LQAGLAELSRQQERLLGVVRNDVGVLVHARSRDLLEPAGERVVGARPFGLRDRVIRDVADEDVLEGPRTAATKATFVELVHEIPPRGVQEHLLELSVDRSLREDRLGPEDLSDDRRPLERVLHGRRRSVQPGGDQTMKRRRDHERSKRLPRDEPSVHLRHVSAVKQHAEEFLDIQWIALRARDHLLAELFREGIDGQQLADEARGFVGGQRLESDRR